MSRKLITTRGTSYVGEYTKDANGEWEAGRRGVRRTLCKVSDLDGLSDSEKAQKLTDLYHLKQRQLRDQQFRDSEATKKAKRQRKKLSVQQARKLWFSELAVMNTSKTHELYGLSIDYYVAACGNHELSDISREHNLDFLSYLKSLPGKAAKTMAPSTQKMHVRHLSVFLNWCYDNELIDRIIRLKSPSVPQKDMETFDVSDLDSLRNFLTDSFATAASESKRLEYKNLLRAYMLATNTLLRLGPIWSLSLKSIDIDKRVVRIRDVPELNWKNKSQKWPDKPINDELLGFLKLDLEERSPNEKYYLDNGAGEPWRSDRSDISKKMSKACKELGLPKIKPFHWGMRATMITELLNRGVKPQVVQKLADHSSLATTMLYFNSRKVDQKIAVDELNDVFRSRSAPVD